MGVQCGGSLKIISSELSPVVHAVLTPAARTVVAIRGTTNLAVAAAGAGSVCTPRPKRLLSQRTSWDILEHEASELCYDDEYLALLRIVSKCREKGVCITATKRPNKAVANSNPPALRIAVKATLSSAQIKTAIRALKLACFEVCKV
jgi:7-keto-8-aminopelargonate synthetase-like enzyme